LKIPWKDFSEGLGSRKNFLDQDILDYLVDLKSLFNEISKIWQWTI